MQNAKLGILRNIAIIQKETHDANTMLQLPYEIHSMLVMVEKLDDAIEMFNTGHGVYTITAQFLDFQKAMMESMRGRLEAISEKYIAEEEELDDE